LIGYKQQMRGHYLGLHPRFQRSTGVCPETGDLFNLTLADRWWDCACGARHDRDVASAQIILAAGRAERLNACGGDIRLSQAEQAPVKQEVAA
jgi:transposase